MPSYVIDDDLTNVHVIKGTAIKHSISFTPTSKVLASKDHCRRTRQGGIFNEEAPGKEPANIFKQKGLPP